MDVRTWTRGIWVSEKPTSAEAVGVDRFHGTGNGVQWQARSANKSLAQHVIVEAQAKTS